MAVHSFFISDVINAYSHIHGHYPDELLLSTISSLPKDRYGDVCDSGKYRGISLSSCITKIIDWVILLKYPHCFRTSELQFANKKHHATPMCTLALKEVVKYYTSRRSSVYCCLLDATKAFDRVKFDKLFEIMIARDIPSCAIRLVFDMYNRQKVRTVWNGQYSSSFSTSNGVRQGGVLSPILFTLYIDVLLERLESSGVSCHIDHEYLGSLCSADDLALLAPTVFSLRRMLKICEEFSVEYDIIFFLFAGRHGSLDLKRMICCHRSIIKLRPWRLWLPVSWVFVQQFVQTDNKETSKVHVTVTVTMMLLLRHEPIGNVC